MDDELRLEGGKLVLFRRNGLWQARIAIGNRKYLWKSLRTSNEADARRAGLRLFHQTEFKIAEGLPVQTRSFNDVIGEYTAARERDHDLGKAAKQGSSIKHTSDAMLRQIKRVSKFWEEYAGTRTVDAVDGKVLRDYIPWRKTYYHGKSDIHHNAKLNPTDKTLQWEMMLAKMILRYAHDQGYRANKPLPTFTFTPKTKRIRPHFTATEFKKMRISLRKWIDETDNKDWKASRWLLHDYVHMLGMSGIRVGEANNLRIRDVEPITDVDGRSTIQLSVRGKTGTRTVQPHIDLAHILDDMNNRRGETKPDDLLFVMPDGSEIGTLIDQFNTFLKFARITHNSNGEKYTLYSLRHYYAVRSLGRADIYSIAQNMGTSVQMIEQYYGKHGISPERARKLGGDRGEAHGPADLIVRARMPKPTQTQAEQIAATIVHYETWLNERPLSPLKPVERRNAIRAILERIGLSAHINTVRQIEGLAGSSLTVTLAPSRETEQLFESLIKLRT
jgi:site-specific recombinase XerD